MSGVGYALSLAPAHSKPVLVLSCIRGTRQITIILPRIKPVADDDRLTVTFGREVFLFVIKRQALKDGKLVEAAATATPQLLAAIAGATGVRGVYADNEFGPYAAPPQAMTKAMRSVCGALI